MKESQQAIKDVKTKLKRLQSIFGDKIGIMLHSGKWKKLEAHYLFIYSEKILAKQIDLYGNKEPSIIKSVSCPEMGSLTHLNLNNNKIVSIEGLAHFKTPCLKVLRLGDNDITKIREIAKLQALQLTELSFYANRIIDLQALSLTNFPQLKILILGLNAISNFRGLNKCQWTKIEAINLQNNRKCCRLSSLITRWNYESKIVYG